MKDIEEQIRKAMQEGKFDNLKNKGKKLDLDDNVHADPEWWLAYHMLQSSGFTLPWIETRQEVENDTTAARAAVRQAWEWRNAALASREHPVESITAAWSKAEAQFREAITRINKKIRIYNLEAPSGQVHLFVLNADRELARLQERDQDTTG